MPIKVLAFAGSPRRHGNSETLLDWVLASMAEEPDVTVEKVPLTEANINPCVGATRAKNSTSASSATGWTHITIRSSKRTALSLLPIFCMGLASQVKLSSTGVFRSRKYVLKLPIVPPERKGKRLGVFLATAGQTWPYVFDAAVPSVKCFYHVIDINDADISYLMVNGVDEKGAIESTRLPALMP